MKNKRLFTYVFLFGLLVNGSACGSDHNETDFPETPGGETPPSPSGLQAYMLTTTDTRTYDLRAPQAGGVQNDKKLRQHTAVLCRTDAVVGI